MIRNLMHFFLVEEMWYISGFSCWGKWIEMIFQF